MSTEIATRHTTAPATLPDKMEYAKALAASGMLPAQYRNQPANLLYALEFADSLGLHPMAAITGVHVIEGKPSASSALISALVRRAGHKLRITGDDTRAVAQIVRADDPGFTFECTWTMDRAKQAGLANKKVWQNYPAAMLKARAITEVAREACEEALSGMHYTPEELGANVNEDGLPVDATVQQLHRVQPGGTDQWTTSAPTQAGPGGATVIDPESFVPHPDGQAFADQAEAAQDQAGVKSLWALAARAEVINSGVLAPDTKAPSVLGDYLTRLAKTLPEVAPAGDEDDVVDGEVIPDADEHSAAVAELRAFAAEHHIADIDADAYTALGAPLDAVTPDAIRGLLVQLRTAA